MLNIIISKLKIFTESLSFSLTESLRVSFLFHSLSLSVSRSREVSQSATLREVGQLLLHGMWDTSGLIRICFALPTHLPYIPYLS